MAFRQDGLSNALSGIGGVQDRTTQSTYIQSPIQPDEVLTAIWTSSGIGKKICSLQIDDMIRQGIEVKDDPDGKLVKELNRLKVWESLQRLLYWTDLYGGAIAVMVLKGTGATLEAPLLETKAPAPLETIRVFPATRKRMISNYSDRVFDPSSQYFGDFEHFIVQPPDSEGQFKAHVTRCLVSKGLPVPPDETIEWRYRYWGVSRLQPIFDDLAAYDTVHNAFSNLVHQATIGKLTVHGLAEILSNNDTASENLKQLMDNIAKTISYLNMILMSDGDSFERDQLSLGGWREVSQIFKERLASTAGYSTSVLFETASSSGLSASSAEDSATERYNNSVQVRQETDLRPLLQKVIMHVAPMVGLPPDIQFTFKPLREPTPKETAEIHKLHTDTDVARINAGIIFPEEARSRLEGDTYGNEVTLDPSYHAAGPEEMQQEAELQAALKAQATASKAQPKAPVKLPAPPKPKAK